MSVLKKLLSMLCLMILLAGVCTISPVLPEGVTLVAEANAASPSTNIKKYVPDAPTIKLTNGTSVRLTWKKYTGAVEYIIYRRTESTAFKKIGVRTSRTFTDTTAKAGKVYYYAIRIRTSKGLSKYSPDKGFVVLRKPTVTLSASTLDKDHIEIRWNKIAGANKYRVLIKEGYGTFEEWFTTPGGVRSASCKVTPGKKYTVVIQPVRKTAKIDISGPKSAQRSITLAGKTYVWRSETGSKYHRINNCGNMNPDKAVKLTLEEAKSMGLGWCSNCQPPK